jgi:DNA invertase Pin-like site-specific DNA recombinase
MTEQMKRETQERVWTTFETLMQQASGDQPYTEAVAEIRALLGRLSEAFETVASRQQAMVVLAQMDEPSQDHLETFEAIASFVAPILYKMIRAMTKQGLKRTPNPPGGRPIHSTYEEKRELCQEILKLVGSGLSVAEAKRRVARRKRLGSKTMDRIWASRSESAASLMTIGDAEELLRTILRSEK